MSVLRGLLLDNLGLKLVALLLALLVYLNVYTERPAAMVVSFPLQLEHIDDSLSLSGPVPAAVQAALKGTGKQLLRLRLTEPPVKISMEGVGPGRFQRMLTAEDLPLGAEGMPTVERFLGPRLIEVQLERRVRRRLPVAVRVDGIAAAGYAWDGTASAHPESLLVEGPRSAVTALDSVRLRAVSIAGKRDVVQAQVMPDSLPDWCAVDPPEVRLRLTLRRIGL